MRFTTLAMVASAMLMTIQAAPLSARHDGGGNASVTMGGSGMTTGGNAGSSDIHTGQQQGGDFSFGTNGNNSHSSSDGHGSSVSVGGDGDGDGDHGYNNKNESGGDGQEESSGDQSANGHQGGKGASSSSSSRGDESQNGLGSQLGLGSGSETGVSGQYGKGNHGSDGESGNNNHGSAGENGMIGNSGQTGASGKTGQTGTSGKTGQTGVSEKTGQNGASGASGKSGQAGASGLGLGLGSDGLGGGNSLLSSLLPGLSDVTSVLDLNNVLDAVQVLPANVQDQILGSISKPTSLTKLIGGLPSHLQSVQLKGLPSKVQRLPTSLLGQLVNLNHQVGLLPANLQAIVGQLPAGLQAKVISLPSLIHNLQSQIDALSSNSLQSKLAGIPDLLITVLSNCQFDEALTTLESLLGNHGSGGTAIGLPIQLEQQLEIVQTILTKITTLTSSSSGHGRRTGNKGKSGTVTILTGTTISVETTVTLVVSELKTVRGAKVSSLQDVINIPAKFCKDQSSGTNDLQFVVSSLLTVTGVHVSALTDKVAVPLELAQKLKSL